MNQRAAITLATREQILTRVFELLQSVAGDVPVYRNRRDVLDLVRPAIVLLDGTEKNLSPDQESIKTVRLPAALVLMSPQIFVLLKERDNAQNATVGNVSAPIGAELNGWIDAIRGVLANDPTLLGMLTSTGQVIYRGAWTDMQTGSTLVGELRLFIDLIYVWLPPA
jgi:SpoU rRNA methylase family enzyme